MLTTKLARDWAPLNLLGVAALAAIAALGIGCDDDDSEIEGAHTAIDVIEHGVESGEEITMSGEVEEVYESGAFTLDYDRGMSNAEILVVPSADLELLPTESDEVVIEGTVDRMTIAEIEREFGWDWNDYEVDFDTNSIVVADALVVTDYDYDYF